MSQRPIGEKFLESVLNVGEVGVRRRPKVLGRVIASDQPIGCILIQRHQQLWQRMQFPSPNWFARANKAMSKWMDIFIRARTTCTSYHSLATTWCFDHDYQVPTTERARGLSLLTERGYRNHESHGEDFERSASQGCVRLCQGSPHHNQSELPSNQRWSIPG